MSATPMSGRAELEFCSAQTAHLPEPTPGAGFGTIQMTYRTDDEGRVFVTVQTKTLLISEHDIGFHGSVGEPGFPDTRRELDDVFGRVDAHALQHIDQVGVHIDAV